MHGFSIRGSAARSVTLVTALALCTAPATAAAQAAALMTSDSPDRSDAVPLDGATVSGVVHVHYPGTDREVKQVQFFLDFETRPEAVQGDGRAPFDLAGSRSRWRDPLGVPTARPFDTTQLVDGEHTLHAFVRGREAPLLVVSRFVVDNAGAAGVKPALAAANAETVSDADAGAPVDDAPVVATRVVEPLPASEPNVTPTPSAPMRPEAGPIRDAADDESLVERETPDEPFEPVDDGYHGPGPGTDVPGSAGAVSPEPEPTDEADPSREPGARIAVACDGLTCTFDASDSTAPSSEPHDWSWDFGDGTVANYEPVVTHTYASAGARRVSLTVWDERCEQVSVKRTFAMHEGARGTPSSVEGEGL